MIESKLVKSPSPIFMGVSSVIIVSLIIGISSFTWVIENSNRNQENMLMEQQQETEKLKTKVIELEKKIEELKKQE